MEALRILCLYNTNQEYSYSKIGDMRIGVKFTVKLHNLRSAKFPYNLEWLCRFLTRPSATDYSILIIFLWPKRQLGLSARIMRAFTNFISHSLPFLPIVLWGFGPWARIVLQGVLWFRYGINFTFWMKSLHKINEQIRQVIWFWWRGTSFNMFTFWTICDRVVVYEYDDELDGLIAVR